jgi:hypothetical protein
MTIKAHPIFDAYEFDSETGLYRKIGTEIWRTGHGKPYLSCSIYSLKNKISTTLRVYRAMWETFNGPILDKKEINHIDGDKMNNKLSNLRCATLQENRKRRNHDFLANVREAKNNVKKNIKSTDIETNEIRIFRSKNNCALFFGCSPALVYIICEKKNHTKLFEKKIKFEYTDDKVDTVVKDARIGRTKYIGNDDEVEAQRKEVRRLAMQKYLLKKNPDKKKRIKKTEEEKKEANKRAVEKYLLKKKLEKIKNIENIENTK